MFLLNVINSEFHVFKFLFIIASMCWCEQAWVCAWAHVGITVWYQQALLPAKPGRVWLWLTWWHQGGAHGDCILGYCLVCIPKIPGLGLDSLLMLLKLYSVTGMDWFAKVHSIMI